MSQPPPRTSVVIDDWRFLLLAVLLGLALRLDFLFANNFVIDADEAIVGLMASDINEGAGIPAFYYGQHYMGSLEPLVAAGAFSFFGESNETLKAVPLAFSLVLILMIYALAYEIAGKGAARIAAALCAIPPSPLVVWSAMARGGFIEILVIGAAALYLTVRWIKAAKPPPFHSAVIGAVLGLGWWVNNQIIYFILPIGLFMAARLFREKWRGRRVFEGTEPLQHVIWGAVGFIAGGFPFWTYNIRNGFASFGLFKGAELRDMLDHFSGLFTVALPMLLGGKRFWTEDSVYPFATLVVLLVYSLLLFAVLSARRRWVRELFRLKIDRDQPIELFLIFGLTCLVVFAMSSFGWLVEAPRYLLPLYIAIFVLTGAAIVHVSAQREYVYLPMTAMFIALNLASSYWGGRAVPGEPMVYGGQRVSKNHDDLIDWLDEHAVEFVHTNYWIGYRLAFETNRDVRFIHFGEPDVVRIPAWEEEALAIPTEEVPFVLVPAQASHVRRAFEVLGYTYKETGLSGYVVFYEVKPIQGDLKEIAASRISVSATYNTGEAPKAVDGDEITRWGSAHPQLRGMEFLVQFDAPVTLRGMSYRMGKWGVSDFPRGLIIDAELENGSKRTLLQEPDYGVARYFLLKGLDHRDIDFFWNPMKVKKIRFTQTGEDKIFDWSIAELKFFE